MSSHRVSDKRKSSQKESTDQTRDQHWRNTEYVHVVQVEKQDGPFTEEIASEYKKKGTEKANQDQLHFEQETAGSSKSSIDMEIDSKKDAQAEKTMPRFISGYAGYIPGADRTYGLSFRNAVDAGAVEWGDAQDRLQLRTDETRHYTEMLNTDDLLARVRREHVSAEDEAAHKKKLLFDVSAGNPSVVDYTEDIPGGEMALSERYARAAEDGLELMLMDRETKFDMAKNAAHADQPHVNAEKQFDMAKNAVPADQPHVNAETQFDMAKNAVPADQPHVNAEKQFDMDKNAGDSHGYLDQAYLDATRLMRKSPDINTGAIHRRLDQTYIDSTQHMRVSQETAGTVHKGLDQAYIDATRHMREPFH